MGKSISLICVTLYDTVLLIFFTQKKFTLPMFIFCLVPWIGWHCVRCLFLVWLSWLL